MMPQPADPRAFRPFPFLGNPHVQTVLGSFLPCRGLPCVGQERLVELPDGDRLVMQECYPPGWRPHDRIALLVHGMGGTHDAGYMRRTARLLLARGAAVARLDLRGCGRGAAFARRAYTAACSPDVRAALADLHQRHPAAPLALLGFSLGGNIVLNVAGQLPEHPVANLDRVAVVAPPVDLELCSALIAQRRNRLYETHFVRGLIAQVRRLERCHPDLPPATFPRGLSLRQFDDVYTAPRNDYAGWADYYRRASSGPLLPHIPVPTLVLAARDDPFVAVEPLETLVAPPYVEVEIVPRGGHLGFLGWDGAGGVRWADRRVVDWLCSAAI